MESNVMFSCGFLRKYEPEERRGHSIKMLVAAGAAVLFFVMGCISRSPFLFFLDIACIVLSVFNAMKPMPGGKIQVTPTHLQTVSFDGHILQSYALADISAIRAAGPNSVWIQGKRRDPKRLEAVMAEFTIDGIADCTGLVSAVTRQMSGADRPPHFAAKPVQQPSVRQNAAIQPQPRRLTEDEADRLHAAQHLLSQGMISEQQYSGVMKPAAPQPRPLTADELNEMNAADYQRRKAKIAQQLEMTQTEE